MDIDKYFNELNKVVEKFPNNEEISEERYIKLLKTAKEGLDAYEYCLQELEKELEPFCDDYFKGLSKSQIAELAKKSIRLTTENRKLQDCLQEIKEIVRHIGNTDDKPSCANDDNCPLNGGDGYDNHCNLECPFILGKQILQKISEVE